MEDEDQDDLERRLGDLGADVLARFLSQLAQADGVLRSRIEGLALRSDPDRFGEALRRRLGSVKRGRRFIPYAESSSFATLLDDWLDDLEAGLLAEAPELAVDLLTAFLEADRSIFERVDDSGGSVGMVFGRACGLWARAVARLPRSFDRVGRFYDLHASNAYGVRDGLLDEVAQALDELEMRRLARRYEDDLKTALATPTEAGRPAPGVYPAAAAMGQVARALGDAKLYERSVRILSPEPNDLQREEIAREYLRCGSSRKAIAWLEGCGRDNLVLLAEAYEKLGDRPRLREVRKRRFEQSLDPDELAAYLDLLAEPDRSGERRRAVELAAASPRVSDGARLLFALDESGRAEALLLERREELRKAFYTDLLDLGDRAEKAGCPVAVTLCFRALTEQILDAARARAYRHARRYCSKLKRLSGAIAGHPVLPDHEAYMAGLRERHGRKWSFWKPIDEAGGGRR